MHPEQKNILELLYYILSRKECLISNFISTNEWEKAEILKNKFFIQFKNLYHIDFNTLQQSSKTLLDIEDIEKQLMAAELPSQLYDFIFLNQTDRKTLNNWINYFNSSLEFALLFLFYWNLKHELIPEINPHLPDYPTLMKISKLNWQEYGRFSAQLAQVASSTLRSYPVKYGTLEITNEKNPKEKWHIQVVEIKEGTIRLLISCNFSTSSRNLRLILQKNGENYLLAKLEQFEPEIPKEYEINTTAIPFVPWQLNIEKYSQFLSIQELGK